MTMGKRDFWENVLEVLADDVARLGNDDGIVRDRS
jgi:hypothetical protein